MLERAGGLRAEDVVAIEGQVVARPAEAVNARSANGRGRGARDLVRDPGPAETPPIPVATVPGEELPAEELRLRYRYLDLRREELQRNMALRHRLMQIVAAVSDRARASSRSRRRS